MAERSNASSKKNQDAAQDVTTLQKRGRRRLVGAIALVLFAVIVLPMIFDPEPKPGTPPVSIRIPSEEGTRFTPKAAPKPPAQAQAGKAEEKPVGMAPAPVAEVPKPAPEPSKPAAEAPRPEQKPAAKPAVKAPAKAPAPKPAENKVAAAAASTEERFVVQVGAFASPEKVKEIADQLKAARLAHYTESVATAKGSVTRVRLGPFPSKEAAEKARERAKALGLSPAPPLAVGSAVKPTSR